MKGDRFTKDNGVKEFFDKNYGLFGKAFILVKKNCLGSFQLLKVVPLEKVQRNKRKRALKPNPKFPLLSKIKIQHLLELL